MAQIPVLVCLLAVGTSLAGKLPPTIKRCARTDPNVAECLRAAVEDALPKLKNGLPKLGVQPLDPLRIERMELSQGQGPIRLDLVFTNMETAHVLDGVKVKKVSFDADKLLIEAVTVTPKAEAICNYTVNGRVLLLPIRGAGKSTVKLYDVTSEIKLTGKKLTKADGKTYMDITDADIKLTPKKMQLNMENLFNGDKQLGDTMNRVMNENWQLVYNEVSASFNQAYTEIFKRPARALFLHVPLDDVYPMKL